jgi:hypothetical protein
LNSKHFEKTAKEFDPLFEIAGSMAFAAKMATIPGLSQTKWSCCQLNTNIATTLM